MTRIIMTQEMEVERLIELQKEASDLPRLSEIEKAKFDMALAMDQLYYSSKLEGSNLTRERIEEAVNGSIFSKA